MPHDISFAIYKADSDVCILDPLQHELNYQNSAFCTFLHLVSKEHWVWHVMS